MGNQNSKRDNSPPQRVTTISIDVFKEEMLHGNQIDAIICFMDSYWRVDEKLDIILNKGGNRLLSSLRHLRHTGQNPSLGDVLACDPGLLPSEHLLFSVTCNGDSEGSPTTERSGWTLENLSLIVDNQLRTASELKLETVVILITPGYPNPELEKLITVLYHKYCLTDSKVKELHLITLDQELLPLMKDVLLEVHERVSRKTKQRASYSDSLSDSTQPSSWHGSSTTVDATHKHQSDQNLNAKPQAEKDQTEQILNTKTTNNDERSSGNTADNNMYRGGESGHGTGNTGIMKTVKETMETKDGNLNLEYMRENENEGSYDDEYGEVENPYDEENGEVEGHCDDGFGEDESPYESEVYQNFTENLEKINPISDNVDRKNQVSNQTVSEFEAGNNPNSQSLSSSHNEANVTDQERTESSLVGSKDEGANHNVSSMLDKGDNYCRKKTDRKFSNTVLETFPDIKTKKQDYERSASSGSEREDSLDFENVFESDSGYQIKDENREENQALDEKENTNLLCPICILEIDEESGVTLEKCQHKFCRKCLDTHFQTSIMKTCPVCRTVYGKAKGNQPEGIMFYKETHEQSLPGYEDYGVITIDYEIPDGIQGEDHPEPGMKFKGARRTAFLPKCPKGEKVLKLLQKAFDQKLIFTVGTSQTSGKKNVVTWNDIHHKTRQDGGPTRYGYPDPGYLDRVLEELRYKGITDDD